MAIPLERPTSGPGEQARERFVGACREALARWDSTPAAMPEPGSRVGRRARWRTAREARRLVDALAREVEECPSEGPEREAWKHRVAERIRDFGERRLGWPEGYRNLVLGEGFYRASIEFVRRARAFDPALETEELFQALRNVWIANSLQLLLGREVECGEAIFAYSMLYPVTDNHLDDPTVPAAAKMAFNRTLGSRLAGEPVHAADGVQREAFRLVARLEAAWPRARWPEVWESLTAIHRGQEGSLLQQEGIELGERQLLALSMAKGAASVWADAALVAGELDDGALRFAVGYGFALQLLDDLQDAREDRAVGHRTIFSSALDRGPLDEPVSRLFHFVAAVVEEEPRFSGAELSAVRDLIHRNCTALLVGAVAEDPALCSRRFARRLERRWPLAFAAQRRLARHARRRWTVAAEVLRGRFGVSSLLDLLAAEPGVAEDLDASSRGPGEAAARVPSQS